MSRFVVGDRKRVGGRVYEWVEPGWWQMRYTDEERRMLASGNTPESWESTRAETSAALSYAKKYLSDNRPRRAIEVLT